MDCLAGLETAFPEVVTVAFTFLYLTENEWAFREVKPTARMDPTSL
jgi:hypothetical protein